MSYITVWLSLVFVSVLWHAIKSLGGTADWSAAFDAVYWGGLVLLTHWGLFRS
jgi:hypothetical protein